MRRTILWTLLAACCGYLEADDYAAAAAAAPPACVNPNGEAGRCVAVNDCPSIVDVIQKLSTTENFSKVSPQSNQGKELRFVRDSRCKGAHEYSACCAYDNEPTCGEFSEDRIIAGKISPIDSYPWLALIEYNNNDNNNKSELLCGGSLVSRRHVLTAASCLSGDILNTSTPKSVRLGEFDTSTDTDCVPDAAGGTDCSDGTLTVPIRSRSVHPEYDAATGSHDVALITLENEVPLSDFIKPICLPLLQPTLKEGQQTLRLAGWNVHREIAPHTQKHHTFASAEPIDLCRQTLGRTDLNDNHYCGKSRLRNVVDHGGPLMSHVMRHGDQRLNVVGVAGTLRKDLDTKDETDVVVYAKVFDYIHWIRNEMTM